MKRHSGNLTNTSMACQGCSSNINTNTNKRKKKKKRKAFRVLRDQIEMWAERELEDCNIEGSLKEKKNQKKKKQQKQKRWSLQVRKQKVWKLPTFLLYCFAATAAYLISFLPFFLSTQFINTDRNSLLWLRYLYISFFFFLGA